MAKLSLGQWMGLGGGTAVGLSIGTSSIKLVELKRSGKAWQLLHFGMVQLPDEAVVNREIINSIAVSESLKNLIDQIKLNSESVCISLSGTSLIVKRMQVEVANLRDLKDQVFWEAEQYIPFDISEVVMDYHVLSRTKSKVDVLLVAVKRTILESYMSAVEEASLKARVVDIDYFAAQNAFEANYKPNPTEAVAIVDIGASSTKVVVAQGGVPVFTKDSSLGGRGLTQEIQKHLSLSFNDAEMLKIGGGHEGGTPQEVSELMNVMSENLSTEIKRSLDFYNASSSGAPVSYVLLSGGSSRIPGLSKTIEDGVGLPTQMLNPFNSITYDPAVFSQDYIESIAAVASVPIGLALRAAEK